MLTLEVSVRDGKESPNALRVRGAVPAVFYGRKEPATPIVVDAKKLSAAWKTAGETTVISLTGAGEPKETLFKDVQFHPVSGDMLHADFYVLEKGKKIEINVPLVFEGIAPAEKAGHIVVKTLHEVEIEVLPAELPHELKIDISKLENVGDRIVAGDIPLPPSATLKTNPEEIIVSVTEFKEEKEEVPVAPVEGAAEGAAPAGEAGASVPSEGAAAEPKTE